MIKLEKETNMKKNNIKNIKLTICWILFFAYTWTACYLIQDKNSWMAFPAIITGLLLFVFAAFFSLSSTSDD